jgi:hypothetical protein
MVRQKLAVGLVAAFRVAGAFVTAATGARR